VKTVNAFTARRGQSGMVLVSAMLLLLVVTIMAMSMFRSFGMQEKIAGNTREKQRALQVAMSTQQYAEWWLTTQSNAPRAVSMGLAADAAAVCANNVVLDANQGQGQICLNSLPSQLGTSNLTNWANSKTPNSTAGGGVAYTPPLLNYTGSDTNASVPDIYAARPRFYIGDLGPLPTGRGEVYQVDAYSFGESAATAAIVESTVSIICLTCNLGNL
jgi:type IV pilus assembly protein PilX